MTLTEALSRTVTEHLKELAERGGEVLMSGIDHDIVLSAKKFQ